MEVASSLIGDVVLLKPQGELTSRGKVAGAFWSYLHRGTSKFVVSFENVRAINSVGLSTLLEFKRLAEASGGQIKLCRVSENLKKVFRVAQLSEVFSFYDDEDVALAGFIKGLPLMSADSSISRHRN
jgi:anti-anti-sigma factor